MRATEEHCKFCFDAILAELQGKDVQEPNFDNAEHPVFVTWKASTKLRGCIGSFTPLPLHQGLQKYAKAAAFYDSRFKPIILEEVKGLTCSLSILHSFEEVENILSWTIGVHGLRMQYQNYHAVYLPQVALEQKWSQMDTIRSLLVKSGYKGDLTESVIKTMKLCSSVNQGMKFGGCNPMTCGMPNCCCRGMNIFKLPVPNLLPFGDCSSQYGLKNPDHLELRAEAAIESALLSLVKPRESDIVLKKAICGSPISQQEAMCAIIGQRYHDAQIAGYIREIVQEHRVNRYAKLATSNACRSRVSNHFWA